jgi:CBS domain-containing protein
MNPRATVLIVDGAGRLIGIVTTYDYTEYLRQRAEDMMLVEDIETTVKDLVLAPFRDERGDVDRDKLATAIEEITGSQKALFQAMSKRTAHLSTARGTS